MTSTHSLTPGGRRIESAIRAGVADGGPAIVGYTTAGFPAREAFAGQLRALAQACAVVEVGIPFSDPMADGVTIQRASRVALAQGVTPLWILEQLTHLTPVLGAPIVLMTYLNPLLALEKRGGIGAACAAAGVAGVIIPDLPIEESGGVRADLSGAGVGLVQLVSPVTAPKRMSRVAAASEGFVYAVTVTGVTGGGGGGRRDEQRAMSDENGTLASYLGMVRACSRVPVCAGFGIRTRAQVAALSGLADGAIVGSAIVERAERAEDLGAFVRSLKGA